MKLLITAGPTREPLDQVRFISNRSSGKVGVAIADAAAAEGHTVTLLLGPGVVVPEGPRYAIERFTTTASLQALLEQHFPEHDVLIMAAAVADYRPTHVTEGKLPRRSAGERLTLTLEPTPDLSLAMAQGRGPHQKIVVFALEEPQNLVSRAREKLARKHADAIVANPLDTMDADMISPLWIVAGAEHTDSPGELTKPAFGRWLIKKIASL